MTEKKERKFSKKDFFLILWVVCLAGFLGLAGWWLYRETQYQTYFHEKEGFFIKYPKTWTVASRSLPGMIAGFVSPKENALDTFLENIAITSTDLSKKSLTLEQYATVTVEQMKGVFKDIRIEGVDDLELAGHAMKRISLRADGSTASVMIIYAFIAHAKAYNITYMGTTDSYVKDRAIIDYMMSSLKVYF